MGGDLVIFWLMGEYHPKPPIMENAVAPKFSKPSRNAWFFYKKFLYNGFIIWIRFLLSVQDYDSNLQNEFWLLMASAVLYKCVSSLSFYTFSNMFRHLVFANLLFTLYIIYFTYIIYIIYYIIQLLSRDFLTKI